MIFGSLFAGIGGFDLGLERAGMTPAWQVEIDDDCNRVLAKHWPDVARFRDVRECGAGNLSAVDLICGGFPCQPHSVAGRRLGGADDRDLWGEFARIVRELRPQWVLAENVPGLLSSEHGRFFGRVLRDLAACGYDVEWDCISAKFIGAPHLRNRIFIVAHSNGTWELQPERGEQELGGWVGNGGGEVLSNSERFAVGGDQQHGGADADAVRSFWVETERGVCGISHGLSEGLDGLDRVGEQCSRESDDIVRFLSQKMALDTWQATVDTAIGLQDLWTACSEIGYVPETLPALPEIWRSLTDEEKAWVGLRISTGNPWCAEWPGVPRATKEGQPRRMDRLRQLGNAVVPQVVEFLGRMIMEAEEMHA